MIVESKYKIGDKVYFIGNGKLEFKSVTQIHAKETKYGLTTLYMLEGQFDEQGNALQFSKNTLFTTKEELIASL